MKLTPADPDIETIISRIRKNDLDLQPEFQRGEVWGDQKKIKLIDTILRQWHIPPIHIIQVKETGRLQVLDGQQRLAAIRDFVAGKIKVNGLLPPHDPALEAMHGFTYAELPEGYRRRFDQFTIRVFNISDYLPEEPGELFFRLNQPATLTAAEQRNAFFGPAREQIKNLVLKFSALGLSERFIGFNNSRMAFDDVVARLCVFLEANTLAHKVTAGGLADRYRSAQAFSEKSIARAERSLQRLGQISLRNESEFLGFNKATLFSWLWFLGSEEATSLSDSDLNAFYRLFESYRRSPSMENHFGSPYAHAFFDRSAISNLLLVFNDRAAARVNDTSSLLTRDIVIWTFCISFFGPSTSLRRTSILLAANEAKRPTDFASCEQFVAHAIGEGSWSSLI